MQDTATIKQAITALYNRLIEDEQLELAALEINEIHKHVHVCANRIKVMIRTERSIKAAQAAIEAKEAKARGRKRVSVPDTAVKEIDLLRELHKRNPGTSIEELQRKLRTLMDIDTSTEIKRVKIDTDA